AEDLGFTSAWFYDSQMLNSDVYATLTLAAEHTKRIRIGTGIAVPSNRIAPVTAHSIATINQLAPGRTMLGIGTGFTGRNMMGPIAAVALHALWETSAVAAQLPPTLAPLCASYRDEYVGKLDMPADRRYMKVHEGHMIYVKPGEERFLTPELIASFSMTAARE